MKINRSNKAGVNTAAATISARTLASTAFAVLMTAILVLGLSPITKASYADTASDASAAQESSVGADEGAGGNGKSDANDDADSESAGSDSGEEDGTGSLSEDQGTEIDPGKYGKYTFERNSTKNAFEGSDYDAFRDSVATEWLGIAGSFHITGFDEVTTSSHIYGNILAKKLTGSNNFGLDHRYDDAYGYKGLSYIQEYPEPAGDVDGHDDGTFVIGSKNTVTATDNNNHLAINEVQLSKPNKLVQDANTAETPFIDLDEVKTYTTKVSDDLAKVADVGASVSNENGNIYIDYEGASGCAYVSLTAAELNKANELFIRGMKLNGECSVVINVDMTGVKQLNLSKVHVLSPDGEDMPTGEIDSTVGYVMFNIKNSTSDMTIELTDRVLASVLAPNATINLAGSAAGTYIGSKVNVTAESHARPFRGTLKPVDGDLSVQKIWKDASGNVEEDVDHDPITVKVLQRSKAKDGDWSDWAEYETVTLSKDNGWHKSWTKLPKKDTDGTTYEYKIEETDESKAANPDYDSAVDHDGTAWVITNTRKGTAEYTKVSVTKAWLAADGTAESDDVVAGHGAVQAQLYKKSGDGEFVAEGDPVTLSKDNSWSCTWEKLVSKDADGTTYEYKVKETDESKAANPDYDSTVDHDGTAWVITNTRKGEEESFSLSGYSMRAADAPTPEADKLCYVDPKVVKVLDGRALKAGEFSFQLIDDETGNVVSTAQNDEAGMVDFDAANNISGDDMNPCCLKFTAPGTYTYTVREDPSKEKDSSIDYSTEVVKFVTTIEADETGALKEKESYYVKYPTAADAEAGTNGEKYASTEHPSITNKVKSLSLSLVKSDAATGVGLEGAVYALYRVDDSVETGAVQVMTATSNAEGRMVFTGADASAIKLGDQYFFQEVSAPAGYSVSENKSPVFTIQQASDGKYYLVYVDDAATVEDAGAQATKSDTHAGTVDDPIAYKEGTGVSDAELAVTFNKLASDGSAVSGAKLAVYDESGTEIDSWTTDGVGHVLKGLVSGKNYTLSETEAPNGYRVASELVFTVNEYGKVSIVKGADNNDELNAYAEGSTLNLIDYKQDEKVEKKEVVKKIGISDDKEDSSSSSSISSDTAKTGDSFSFAPFAVALALAAAALALAGRKRRKE